MSHLVVVYVLCTRRLLPDQVLALVVALGFVQRLRMAVDLVPQKVHSEMELEVQKVACR